MVNRIDGQIVRQTILEVVAEYDQRGPGYFQATPMLREISRRLNLRSNLADEQLTLTLFYELFRNGLLAWGHNIDNPAAPFCHITERGRATLRQLSRDPYNIEGYLEYLRHQGGLNSIAESYIRESLDTYNANCFKATAVMTGAAAESLILELRDALVARISALGRTPSTQLQDWRIKRVIDAIQRELDPQKPRMGNIREAYEAYWPAFLQQIRAARNEAGHPSSIEPVTPQTVHASLLIFPELVKLTEDLRNWISQSFS